MYRGKNKIIIIIEEIKNYLYRNQIKIEGKVDSDNFDANGETIRVLFDFLDLDLLESFQMHSCQDEFISLKSILKFSQNIVTSSGECLDYGIVEKMFRVLGKGYYHQKKNNQDINQKIGLKSLEFVENVMKLKIKFSFDTLFGRAISWKIS